MVRPELWLLPETSLPHIIAAIDDVQPTLVVIDSIQSIADPDVPSAPGSVVHKRLGEITAAALTNYLA